MSNGPRVLLIQRHVAPAGGGSGVAAWMIEALKADHRITLLTWRRPQPEAINRTFGSALAEGDFEVRICPSAALRVLSLAPTSLDLLKEGYLMRRARRLAPAFDLSISAANEHDLGRRGIQYVHYPRFLPVRPERDLTAFYHRMALIRLYRAATLRLTGTQLARVAANRTLTNSDWVGHLYRSVHAGPSETLYPPAAGIFPDVPWAARADGVVCIGRLAREKRIELMIEIVERVRSRGHALHLHIVGTVDHPPYAAEVRRLVRARAGWVTLHEDLSRAALCALVARQRYGLHGMAEEHFGMAIAEMVCAGCIPFVPDGGGQREIVGGDPRLRYTDAAAGAERLVRVMDDVALQAELRATLAARAPLFTPAHFMRRFRAVVAAEINGVHDPSRDAARRARAQVPRLQPDL